MSEQENIDLSKIIGLIMENPALIEQISSLAKQSTSEKQSEEAHPVIQEADIPKVDIESKAEPTYAPVISKKNNRAQVLGALKPYVSSERAKAIDSMISIANILDMMKER